MTLIVGSQILSVTCGEVLDNFSEIGDINQKLETSISVFLIGIFLML